MALKKTSPSDAPTLPKPAIAAKAVTAAKTARAAKRPPTAKAVKTAKTAKTGNAAKTVTTAESAVKVAASPVAAAPELPRLVVTDDDIRVRAYFLALEHGGKGGNLDFWLLAEHELRGKATSKA